MQWNDIRKHIKLPIFLCCVIVVLRDILTVILSKAILEAIVSMEMNAIVKNSVWLGTVLIMYTLINMCYKRRVFSQKKQLTYQLEDKVLSQYQSLLYWRAIPFSEVLGIIKEVISVAAGEATDYFISIYQIVFMILCASIYMCFLNPFIWVTVVLFTLVIIVLTRKDVKRLPALYDVFFEHLRILDAKLWEQIKNHEAASILDQSKVLRGFHQQNEKFIFDLKKIKVIENKLIFASKFGSICLMILVVAIGGILYVNKIVTISDIYASVILIPTMTASMIRFPAVKAEKKKIMSAWETMDHFFESPSVEKGIKIDFSNISSIRFENVCYQYGKSSEWMLDHVNIQFGSGLNCIAGPSGGGKSTILLLIMRFLENGAGRILINEEEIKNIDRQWYYSNIAYIDQKATILSDTIKQNIILNQSYDEARLKGIIQDLELNQWIESLPEGVNTKIDSLSISTGERQKICFARVLYRNVKILLLDEAMSAVDIKASMNILQLLKKKSENENLIVIYVSHDKRWISEADHVFWIQKGLLVDNPKAEKISEYFYGDSNG